MTAICKKTASAPIDDLKRAPLVLCGEAIVLIKTPKYGSPFIGVGKPEPLLGNLVGYWSRRIDETHRLVYCADDADLDVIACRGHYDD